MLRFSGRFDYSIIDFLDSSGVVTYTDYPVSVKKIDSLIEVQTISLLLH